uniref:Cytochrome P450 n=1 Tax=Stomoxys calcitrans TaxID=35570 RepID=A0A1I8QBH3_STOCA
MFPLFVILGLIVVIVLILYLISFHTYWQRRGVCQLTPLPLVGNYQGLGSSYHFRDVNQHLYNHFKSKGQAFGGIYVFMKRAALMVDLDLIKQILIKDFANFPDRGVYNNAAEDPLTAHMIALEGEEWRCMRHKLTPTFTASKMKYMFPTVVKVGERFAKTMAENRGPTGVLELKDLCGRFTTDVIGNAVFGIDSNCLKDPQEEFRKMGNSVLTDKRHHAVVEQFILTNPAIAKKFHMKLFKDDMTKYFLNLVQQIMQQRLENNEKRKDFMDLLLELKAQDEELLKAEGRGIDLSHGLTLEQITAQLFSFLIAGFESSSTTMAFCLYELACHQDLQDKLREEVVNALKENQGELSFEAIQAMGYLDQVISETLRLYAPLSYLARVTKNDYRIANSSHVIEKGTMVIIPTDAIHRDPEYFPQPNVFNPDNFEPSVCSQRHSCTFMPFGDGPRNCIGLRFGKMQTKIGLVSLLRRFRFECCPLTEKPIQIDKGSFFLAAKHGIQLKVVDLESGF